MTERRRERERERERKPDKERESESERETESKRAVKIKTEKEREKDRERERERETESERERETESERAQSFLMESHRDKMLLQMGMCSIGAGGDLVSLSLFLCAEEPLPRLAHGFIPSHSNKPCCHSLLCIPDTSRPATFNPTHHAAQAANI